MGFIYSWIVLIFGFTLSPLISHSGQSGAISSRNPQTWSTSLKAEGKYPGFVAWRVLPTPVLVKGDERGGNMLRTLSPKRNSVPESIVNRLAISYWGSGGMSIQLHARGTVTLSPACRSMGSPPRSVIFEMASSECLAKISKWLILSLAKNGRVMERWNLHIEPFELKTPSPGAIAQYELTIEQERRYRSPRKLCIASFQTSSPTGLSQTGFMTAKWSLGACL